MAKCPYCDQKVVISKDPFSSDSDNEIRREVEGTIKKEVMYVCPHCERVLGFSFFMGGWLTGRP